MNVLILMMDEMAPWGCGSDVQTPNIDALRQRGCDFTAAYTPSPICVPTRACIATGKHLHDIGCWSSAEPYAGAPKSWAHQTRDASVETVSFGKLHYRSGLDDTGFGQEVEPIHVSGGVGWTRGLLRKPMCSYDVTAEMAQQIGPGDTDYHAYDRRVAKAADTWLRAPARQDRPWCAFVSFLSPHYPLIAPPADYALCSPTPRSAEPVPDHPVLREMWAFWDHDRHFDDATRGIAHASYRGLCTFVDRQVGRVLDALVASGQAETTRVILTSDHGDMMGQHGFWAKSVMYENSARVPLIVAGPGVDAGRCAHPVSLIDIAPTVAESFGLDTSVYTGRSFLDPDPAREVISEYHDGGSPVGMTLLRWNDGTAQWKYVHYAEGHPPQLFELSCDPEERQDLSALRHDIVETARARLWRHFDPEEVNRRAHRDQARRVAELGGRQAILDQVQWNFTPADSR